MAVYLLNSVFFRKFSERLILGGSHYRWVIDLVVRWQKHVARMFRVLPAWNRQCKVSMPASSEV